MAGSDNINAGRILAGASVPRLDLSKVVLNGQNTGAPPTIQRGVVEEVIFNPKDLSLADRDRLRGLVINPELVDQVAPNSVVAMLVSDGISDSTPTRVILSPFFQSHFMLPVQAGEQVSVIFEDFQKYSFRGGKWITRASEGLPVEDLNFTHGDRRFSGDYSLGQRTSASGSSDRAYTPGFPNGAGGENSQTLPQDGSTNPYDTIYQSTRSGSFGHTYEVVPRWTKRPQEFVIQGMHNSLIMLGQDRVGYVTGSSTTEQRRYAGTIDLVAGRGRYLLDPSAKTISSEKNKTSPFVSVNSRSLNETDKAPKLSGRGEQLQEGDPDFVRDAARLYISMKTLGDTNFRLAGTTEGSVNNVLQPSGINYSPNSLYPTQFSSSSADVGSSYIVGKADHVRLVARRSVPEEDASEEQAINGSVLILKEGNNRTPEDKNAQAADTDHLSYLYMSPEGRVQIDGMQIFLGGAALRETGTQKPTPDIPSNSDGATAELTVGEANQFAGAEPYIKWSEFKKVVEGQQRQNDDLHNAFSDLVEAIKNAQQTSICPPGGPDAAWVGLVSAAETIRSNLNSSIDSHRQATNQAVYRSRSSKIFGQ